MTLCKQGYSPGPLLLCAPCYHATMHIIMHNTSTMREIPGELPGKVPILQMFVHTHAEIIMLNWLNLLPRITIITYNPYHLQIITLNCDGKSQ